MKKTGSIAALLALISFVSPLHAQTVAGPAHLNGAGPVTTGGFVGARLRIPLGGTRESAKDIRASLTVAPMQRSEGTGSGGPAWRFGEGLEFGFAGGEVSPHFSLAGQSLAPSRYAPGGRASAKGRSNLSDAGTVAVVVGGLAILAGVGLLVALDASDDPDRCCE
ncbi:hypothetical protein [Sphingopyxis sp.]|uniref:hypothetical protein n=1 Tax=Sphingopyxis sp. TaxID=1908224 RepID=UPI002FC6E4F9